MDLSLAPPTLPATLEPVLVYVLTSGPHPEGSTGQFDQVEHLRLQRIAAQIVVVQAQSLHRISKAGHLCYRHTFVI